MMLCQLKSISKCSTCMSIRSPEGIWPSHYEMYLQSKRMEWSQSDESIDNGGVKFRRWKKASSLFQCLMHQAGDQDLCEILIYE